MKKKLFNLLPSFITTYKHGDKIAHAIGGLLIFILTSLLLNIHIGVLSTVLIGGLIEVYDKYSKKGTPDFLDFLFTILIPCLVYLISFIIL